MTAELNSLQSLGSLRVLYVEDDKNAREELLYFLENVVAEVYIGTNGKEGYELYAKNFPDLIITDIQMPMMTGIQMLQKIRQSDTQTPVIITSAYNETNYLLDAINIGVYRYILKPIDLMALKDAMISTVKSVQHNTLKLTLGSNLNIQNLTNPLLMLLGFERNELVDSSISKIISDKGVLRLQEFLENRKNGISLEYLQMSLLSKNNDKIETRWTLLEERDGELCFEVKDIEAFAQNEILLQKELFHEKYTKEIIFIQSKIHEAILASKTKEEFLTKTISSFTSLNNFGYAYYTSIKDNHCHISMRAAKEEYEALIEKKEPQPLEDIMPHCPVIEAIKSKKLLIVEDLSKFESCYTKHDITKEAFKSAIILPIEENSSGDTGALNLIFIEKVRIEQETLKQFENIANLIKLGLRFIADKQENISLQVALANEKDFMDTILENAGVMIIVFDEEGSILRFNKLAEDFTSYSSDDVIGKPYFWTTFLRKKDRNGAIKRFQTYFTDTYEKEFDSYLLSQDRKIHLFHWVNTVICGEDCKKKYLITIGQDITEKKQAEETIKQLAFYDPLTKLANRRLLEDRLNLAMGVSERSGKYASLMFFDLDNFKPLNDKYGHKVGDILLKKVAKRIEACVRKTDTVARFGGDEFVVLLSEVCEEKKSSEQYIASIAQKIKESLSKEYKIKTQSQDNEPIEIKHYCSSSIGITLFKAFEYTQDEILRQADHAMYEAKKSGKDNYVFYTQG